LYFVTFLTTDDIPGSVMMIQGLVTAHKIANMGGGVLNELTISESPFTKEGNKDFCQSGLQYQIL